jgi:hypothetical protein
VKRALVLLGLSVACAKPPVPAMHAGAVPPTPGWPTVVFVRPPSACDTGDHARIVDEEGRFVGVLGSGTSFSLPVAPGQHTFFVWPGMDLRDLYPGPHPVDVVTIAAEDPARPTVLAVKIPHEAKLLCKKYAVYAFVRPAPDEAAQWLEDATELTPDPVAGRTLLEQDTGTREYLERARAKQAARR